MRVFLDANILFTAAHNPEGKSAWLISRSARLKVRLMTCTLAVEEADRNLTVKYPGQAPSLKRILANIEVIPTVTKHIQEVPVILPDHDRPIYLSALHVKATHLLTGDLAHFGSLMNRAEKTGGMTIQTVGEYLDSIL